MARTVIPRSRVFQRGLVTSVSEIGIEQGFRQLTNAWLSPTRSGAVERISGFEKVNATEINSGAKMRNLYLAKTSTSSTQTLRFIVGGGDVYTTTYAGTVSASIKSVVAGNAHYAAAQMNDLMFFFDGTTTPFKSTIAATPVISDIGITGRPDVSSASSALGAAGEVKDVVKYFLAELTNTTEGPLSEVFGEIDAKDGKIVNLSGLPTTTASTVTYKVYRTLGNRELPLLAGTYDDNSGTYADDKGDLELTDPPAIHGDSPPSECDICIVHSNRLLAAGGNYLYFSDLNQPESFFVPGGYGVNRGNVLSIHPDDGDEIRALARDKDGVWIFKSDHLYRLNGVDPDTYELRESSLSDVEGRTVGTPSINSVASGDNELYFYYNRSLHRLRRGRVSRLTDDISDLFEDISREHERYGVAVGWYSYRKQVWLSVPRGSANPTDTYIFDTKTGQVIGSMNVGFRDFATIEDDSGNAEFWALSSTDGVGDGFALRLDSGDDFGGTTIDSTVKFAPFSGNRDLAGWVRAIETTFILERQSTGTIDIELITDGATADPKEAPSIDITAGRSHLYQTCKWGVNGHDHDLKLTSSNYWRLLGYVHQYQEVARAMGHIA